MIKFFRKIRQKLLSENRLTKYILYALGEIFLVVVGILIALQVNNWNEERKLQTLKNSYKLALIEDLKKDTTELKKAVHHTEMELDNLQKISEKVSNTHFNIDSIIHIYRFEFSPLIDASRDYNRNTIEGLLSTGHINLFEKDIYNSLMDLYALQNKIIEILEVNLGFYMNYQTSVSLPFGDQINGFTGLTLDNIWEKIDKNQFLLEFNIVFSSKKLGYEFILNNRKNLLQETESVLNLLNE